MPGSKPTATSSRSEIDVFIDSVNRSPNVRPAGSGGRLIFAMDATASRQPTWDQASHIQAMMFEETATLGGLAVQLVYYRGYSECRASRWHRGKEGLLGALGAVSCRGGYTQIGKVLKHAVAQTRRQRVNALVFIGDCVEEDVDALCGKAGELGLLGVPAFMFHEGDDRSARDVFEQIARLTGGACCRFDSTSPNELRDLLSAVAVYASGGRRALEDFTRQRGGISKNLVRQIEHKS
ncbi:MAG: VWA domain-containing protein [Pseudomonadota bacterium]|nr:VWA domain-containing protein [Pseudomonadota bacterium]